MKASLIERIGNFDRSSKIIKRFNPNESRTEFGCPSRLCINTYVGCSHQCVYCYNHWMKGFDKPHEKKNFEKVLKQDIEKIFENGLDSVIISISNSTDPLQEPLEGIHKHTLLSLKLLLEKGLKILILTKNPGKLLEQNYLHTLNPVMTAVEITVPFLYEREHLEPFPPLIEERISCIEKLLLNGIGNLAVRIDPLIPPEIGGQTVDEIDSLIGRLKEVGVTHVISKVFRLVGAIKKVSPAWYQCAKDFYIKEGAQWHKNYYMLQSEKKNRLLTAVYEACSKNNIAMSVCYENFSMPGVVKCDMAESKFRHWKNS